MSNEQVAPEEPTCRMCHQRIYLAGDEWKHRIDDSIWCPRMTARPAALAKQGSPPKCPECGHNDMGRDGLCKESVPLIDKEPHGSRCCNCPCVNFGLRGAWWQNRTTTLVSPPASLPPHDNSHEIDYDRYCLTCSQMGYCGMCGKPEQDVPPPADTVEKCVWAVDDIMDGDLWETACGATFQFNDGGPEDNEFKFCYKCGKPIEVYRRSEDDDED